MRTFTRHYLLPLLFLIAFWFGLWLVVPAFRRNINAISLSVVFFLLGVFIALALYFVGRALERYGYSREDLKRLPEIIEKSHGRLYLPKEVFNIFGDALVFWGIFASAVLMAKNPLRGLVNSIAMFIHIFAFFILLVSMFVWVIIFPLSLYRTLSGKEPHRGLLIDVAVKQTLLYTGFLLAIRLIAIRHGYMHTHDPPGKLIAFGMNTHLVGSLLELAGLNVLFGIAGYYGPRKAGKLTALALTLIVLAELWVAWGMLAGKF
jgi:hypothetical protein